MPELLIDSLQVTANNIGALLKLNESETKIAVDIDFRLTISTEIKNIVQRYDNQLSFSISEYNNEMWVLHCNDLQTEKYEFLGILAKAYGEVVQPFLNEIQECIKKTLSEIDNGKGIMVVAIPVYNSNDRMFCVSISIDNANPFLICHDDVETLINVVQLGIPNIIKERPVKT